MAHIFHFPRPRSLFHLISLHTATEFLTFTLAINKVTGLYGILALFTGYTLNPLQLSHYIYSLLVLFLAAYLSQAIRQRDGDGALKVVGLAWVYVLDTVINSVYTSLFGAGWFLLLAQHLNETTPVAGGKIPGGSMMNDTAGFTDPEHIVSEVNVIAAPASGVMSGQDAVAYGTNTGAPLGGVIFERGSIATLTLLALFCVIRVYLCIIVLSFARSTLRQYIANSSTSYSQTDDPTMAENPFRTGREEGTGWRGKLGRFMLKFPSKRYWLGKDESEDEWVRATSGRFESGRGLSIKVPHNALGERERRARSGTGPPLPAGVKGKLPQ